MKDSNYNYHETNTDLQIALEALRHTEMQLEDFISLANNSDQRAMALAAANLAVATILATFASTLPAPTLALVSSSLFLIVSYLSATAALPRTFHVRGHYWSDWVGHIEDRDSLFEVIKSQAIENDQRARSNMQDMKTSGRRQKNAFKLSAYSFLFFVGSQFGALFSDW